MALFLSGYAADANYAVNKWYVDSNDVQTGGTTYTLTSIQADHNVNVTFRDEVDPDGNGAIELADLGLMSENWLSTDPNDLGNLNGDSIVNFLDFAEFQ